MPGSSSELKTRTAEAPAEPTARRMGANATHASPERLAPKTRKELSRRQTKKAARFNGQNSDGRFSKEGTRMANERMRKVLTVVGHSKRQSKPGNAASPPPPGMANRGGRALTGERGREHSWDVHPVPRRS